MKMITKPQFLNRFKRNKDGAVAVEFALILPVLLIMLFGTMEIGNILYAKSILQQGVETAGRYAMIHIDATTTEIQAEAIARTSDLGSLTPTFAVVQSVSGGISYAVISVSGDYTMITPLFAGRTITITSQMSVAQTDPSDFS